MSNFDDVLKKLVAEEVNKAMTPALRSIDHNFEGVRKTIQADKATFRSRYDNLTQEIEHLNERVREYMVAAESSAKQFNSLAKLEHIRHLDNKMSDLQKAIHSAEMINELQHAETQSVYFEFENSSMLRSASYFASSEELFLTFLSGTTYRYQDVPEVKVINLRDATSPGSYYNNQIKGRYASEKLEAEVPAKFEPRRLSKPFITKLTYAGFLPDVALVDDQTLGGKRRVEYYYRFFPTSEQVWALAINVYGNGIYVWLANGMLRRIAPSYAEYFERLISLSGAEFDTYFLRHFTSGIQVTGFAKTKFARHLLENLQRQVGTRGVSIVDNHIRVSTQNLKSLNEIDFFETNKVELVKWSFVDVCYDNVIGAAYNASSQQIVTFYKNGNAVLVSDIEYHIPRNWERVAKEKLLPWGNASEFYRKAICEGRKVIELKGGLLELLLKHFKPRFKQSVSDTTSTNQDSGVWCVSYQEDSEPRTFFVSDESLVDRLAAALRKDGFQVETEYVVADDKGAESFLKERE